MSTSVPASKGPAAAAGELFDEPLRSRLAQARATATEALLRARNAGGWWIGELSASALSTATAVTALTLVARADAQDAQRLRAVIQRGYEWLIAHQNSDGGWGDTTRSFSNISTTTLVWAAFGLAAETMPAGHEGAAHALVAAERWLTRAAGSLDPSALVHAIEQRYGDDRTFSIPILTMCALCGRLGPEQEGWARVRQLPFEVAALPQRWFGALQLPVVSYALPALIAIGQVRHARRPTPNPVTRWIRDRTRARTLEKLAQLQPANGGFLEATPLTSFVTMSLAAAGLSAHPVVRRGVAFLEASVCADGSWQIDTNLTTWVTTLSVNALESSAGIPPAGEKKGGEDVCATIGGASSRAIRDWLLGQQYRHEHPYTLAAPGGWAWTDLPGGVPDADDTAGALLAVHRLDAGNPAVQAAAEAGVRWLLDLQNRDGGIPTFCRGWGKLPFDRSSPDITAHAMRAWSVWRAHCAPAMQRRIDLGLERARDFLSKTQRDDGAWIPLWFGHQENPADENPVYGTSRVVLALVESPGDSVDRAVRWLVTHQHADGGWGGAVGATSSLEETGLALEALAVAWRRNAHEPALRLALQRGGAWLAAEIENEQWHTPAPIGFYFAKLWYFERLYPLIFATGALTRLIRL